VEKDAERLEPLSRKNDLPGLAVGGGMAADRGRAEADHEGRRFRLLQSILRDDEARTL
jgi:hypothetical protein